MNRNTFVLLATTILLATLLGCGGGETASTTPVPEPAKTLVEPPSTEVAFDIVSKSQLFSEYNFTRAAFSLPMQANLLKGAALESAQDLAKAGWVFIDEAGNLVLAPKADGDKRFIVRPNGSLDIVPLAKKEFASVDALGHDEEGDVTVDFTWHWMPNEVGQSFEHGEIATRYDGDRKARATIYPTRDGWNVLRIREIKVEESAPSESPAD